MGPQLFTLGRYPRNAADAPANVSSGAKTTMCIVFLRFRFLLWPTVAADCTAKQFRCVPL